MKQSKSLMTLTVVAAGAIAANRFVTTAGAQAGAAANTYGVAEAAAAAAGDKVPVTSHGTAIVEAGAAIAAGALVETDAQGRAVTRAAGPIVGRLAPGESAGAAGAFVEVILINN